MKSLTKLTLFLGMIWSSTSFAMSFEQLVACRTQVLQLEHKYLGWPNPSSKPALYELISRAEIEQQVRESSSMADVLEERFAVSLDTKTLQSELERIAASTRRPERLKEIFMALENDPQRVAECFIKPELAKRLIRNAFQQDATIHAGVKRNAMTELPSLGDISNLGAFNEFERTFSKVERISQSLSSSHSVELATPAFEAERARFRGKGGALQESELSFYRESLISEEVDHFTVRVREWPKLSFESWWSDVASKSKSTVSAYGTMGQLVLPKITRRGSGPQIYPDDSWRTPDLPTARSQHAAVWTGTEMLIWGGSSLVGIVSSGSRYNPTTDSWQPMSLKNAPSARFDFSHVWSGSELIIWGGANQSGTILGDGARYNPTSDTWVPINRSGAPSARRGATAVWTGSEMILWSGSGGTLVGGGARYNPVANTWLSLPAAGAPAASYGHQATWTGSEMLILSNDTNGSRRYSPTLNAWRSMAPWPNRRSSATATWTGNEWLVWGGNPAPAIERYRPESDSWSTGTTTNAPTADFGHTAIWSGSELLLWGGCLNQNCIARPGARYSPIENRWSEMDFAAPPTPRTGHSAIWTGSEMLVWGGFVNADAAQTSSGARYSPQLNRWLPTGIASTGEAEPRSRHAAVWTGNEMIVWGGLAQANGSQLISTKRYNPLTDSWSSVTGVSAPSLRHDHTGVWTGSEMIVWGGTDNSTYFRNGGRYNPLTDSWRLIVPSLPPAPPDNTPASRIRHAAVWNGHDMLIWGGSLTSGDTNSGARYRPSTDSWAPISEVNAPTGRSFPPVVWTGSEMIVWGGCVSECPQRNGGRYIPGTDSWTSMPLLGSPRDSGSSGVRVVWTGDDMLVMVGAERRPTTTLPNETRRFNPAMSSWRPTRDSSCQSLPQFDYSAIWTGREMIAFGGNFIGPVTLATTRDGSRYDSVLDRWRRTDSVNAPTGRTGHTSLWTGQEMLVFGGAQYFGNRSVAEFATYYPYGDWDGFASDFEAAQPNPCDNP